MNWPLGRTAARPGCAQRGHWVCPHADFTTAPDSRPDAQAQPCPRDPHSGTQCLCQTNRGPDDRTTPTRPRAGSGFSSTPAPNPLRFQPLTASPLPTMPCLCSPSPALPSVLTRLLSTRRPQPALPVPAEPRPRQWPPRMPVHNPAAPLFLQGASRTL